MKNGYQWIQYISFEHAIENIKTEYYRVLRSCQANRPNENVDEWIRFFFKVLKELQEKLSKKLAVTEVSNRFSPHEKSVLVFIENHPGVKKGEVSKRLNIPAHTVKRIMTTLLEEGLIERFGVGAGTNYAKK